MSTQLISSFQLLMKKGFPVVVFRSPGSKKPILIGQYEESYEEVEIADIDSIHGFLISGFLQSMEGKTFVIRPDIVLNNELMPEPLLRELQNLPDKLQEAPQTDNIQTKASYLETVNAAIGKLKSGALQKIVLSRSIQQHLNSIHLEKLFAQLEKKYQDAFVYILHLPGKGIWAGATPETLISVKEDSIETVALAGTMPVDAVNWTAKEIEEQDLVSVYIAEALHEEQVSKFERKNPVTVQAGKLAHLKTTFTIPKEQLKGRLGRFTSRLHPTPAVCGLPKAKAFEQIQALEKHDRDLYTGFLGPWNMHGQSHLFVNLRCARLLGNTVSLFVGGGITAKSDAEAEWEETVNKSETLLSVLKKM